VQHSTLSHFQHIWFPWKKKIEKVKSWKTYTLAPNLLVHMQLIISQSYLPYWCNWCLTKVIFIWSMPLLAFNNFHIKDSTALIRILYSSGLIARKRHTQEMIIIHLLLVMFTFWQTD